jgi:hypothetical protein
MDNRRRKINGSEMEVQVIIGDMRSEIDLDGLELLKLEFGQPGARVMSTSGTLWLTQQGDPHDHIIKTGQSFTLNQRGMVLVQGLPCGRVLILPPVPQEKSSSYPGFFVFIHNIRWRGKALLHALLATLVNP